MDHHEPVGDVNMLQKPDTRVQDIYQLLINLILVLMSFGLIPSEQAWILSQFTWTWN